MYAKFWSDVQTFMQDEGSFQIENAVTKDQAQFHSGNEQ